MNPSAERGKEDEMSDEQAVKAVYPDAYAAFNSHLKAGDEYCHCIRATVRDHRFSPLTCYLPTPADAWADARSRLPQPPADVAGSDGLTEWPKDDGKFADRLKDGVAALTDGDYRPSKFHLSNSEINATGILCGGAVANIARELLECRAKMRSAAPVSPVGESGKDADDLLRRAADLLDEVPTKDDPTFWGDFYTYTGEHMICTEEGWQPGEAKQSYLDEDQADAILAEVNAPLLSPKEEPKA